MLNLNCVICAELFGASDEVYVTPCGHLFHHLCLKQWLERSKTCPQCRNRCSERTILRVYFNLANLDVSRIDVASLQEQLDNANFQLKIKDKDVQKAEQSAKEYKDRQKKCLKTIAGLEQQVQRHEFVIQSYIEQLKILRTDAKVLDGLRQEVKTLKQEIHSMEGLSTILTSSTADAERLLKNESDPKILSVWVTTLKRELRQCENKKTDIRNVLKVVQSDLRKELEVKRKQEERLSELESENYQLTEKLKTYEAAQNLPNSNDNSNVTVGLNNNILANALKEERRSTISPTIKENVKRIEESNSPYLNIKSSSIGLAPLLKRSQGVGLQKFENLKLSPIKSRGMTGIKMTNGALRKTTSDLSEKYSIFKKPRLGLAAPTSSGLAATFSMKPLSANYVFDGFGGSEKIDPFAPQDNETDSTKEQTTTTSTTQHKPNSFNHLKARLKAGTLRNFKLDK